MFSIMRNAWATPDPCKKILFTLFITVTLRLSTVTTVPFLNVEVLQDLMGQVDESGNALGYSDMLSGGAFANAILFVMSVTPYISNSTILQLLTAALPLLERLAKEGEEGCKKIAAITRCAAAMLGLTQGIAYYFYLYNSSYEGTPTIMFNSGQEQVFSAVVIIFIPTIGTALMTWMGEQANKYGINSDISVLLLSGIVARTPYIMNTLSKYLQIANRDPSTYGKYYAFVPTFVILFLVIIWFVVLMSNPECRIPIQYVKRMVGRKVYGGQASHIPIKIAVSDVTSIISANSILVTPNTIQLSANPKSGFWEDFLDAFSSTGQVYSLVYFPLIVIFVYFHATIQHNPIEMANNFRQSNGMTPGVRLGKPASDSISRILSKLTLIGALFLTVAVLLPIIFGAAVGIHNISLGGTSPIILVGVALDTVKQMESQMMMRYYKGFLD